MLELKWIGRKFRSILSLGCRILRELETKGRSRSRTCRERYPAWGRDLFSAPDCACYTWEFPYHCFCLHFIISKYHMETADFSNQNWVSKSSKPSQDNFHRSMQQKNILRYMNIHKNISYSSQSWKIKFKYILIACHKEMFPNWLKNEKYQQRNSGNLLNR